MESYYFVIIGALYTLIITLPFILSYYSIKGFLENIINKEFSKAKKKLEKEKLFELIFSEEKIKFFVLKKLEDLDRFNYSIAIFYINFGLIVIILYFLSNDQTILKLFNGFLYTFFGINITLFLYLLIKIWLQIKIINLLVKLDELEITYVRELQELAEEEKN